MALKMIGNPASVNDMHTFIHLCVVAEETVKPLPPLPPLFPAATHFERMKCDFLHLLLYFLPSVIPSFTTSPLSVCPHTVRSLLSFRRCDWVKAEGTWAEWG